MIHLYALVSREDEYLDTLRTFPAKMSNTGMSDPILRTGFTWYMILFVVMDSSADYPVRMTDGIIIQK